MVNVVKSSVALTPRQWEVLKDAAEGQKRSVSWLLQEMVSKAFGIPEEEWHARVEESEYRHPGGRD